MEKQTSINLRDLSKLTLKRSQAREKFFKKELEMAKIKREMADSAKNYIKMKQQLKEIGASEVSEEEIKREKNNAIYNDQMAKNQIELAEINTKIVKLEQEIAKEKGDLAREQQNVAMTRETLAKKQMAYIKIVNENQPQERILAAEKEYTKVQKLLIEDKKAKLKQENRVKERENKLADLRKEYSAKLAEREKIRHADVTIVETIPAA